MKRLLGLLLFTVLLGSCNKSGEVSTQPKDFITIHGKVYKVMSIVPADGEHPIWILYPKDSLDAMPTSIGAIVPAGKQIKRSTTIIVD